MKTAPGKFARRSGNRPAMKVRSLFAGEVLNQTVVSHNEAPGGNEFQTRDQVGRALYNCLVPGRRQEGVVPE